MHHNPYKYKTFKLLFWCLLYSQTWPQVRPLLIQYWMALILYLVDKSLIMSYVSVRLVYLRESVNIIVVLRDLNAYHAFIKKCFSLLSIQERFWCYVHHTPIAKYDEIVKFEAHFTTHCACWVHPIRDVSYKLSANQSVWDGWDGPDMCYRLWSHTGRSRRLSCVPTSEVWESDIGSETEYTI